MLAWRFNLGVAQTAVAVVTGLGPAYIGWAGFRIAWKSFRADRAEAATVALAMAADLLAVAVKTQWDKEAAARRVNDPYPLPVAWRAADQDLAEPWLLLRDLVRAWPGGPPGDPAQWPSHAAGLGGQDSEIGTVFADRVPTRRLVILGEPGAGKSVLLIRLLQDLIDRRGDGDPVPVLFSLASWNPRQPLKTWLADQLRRDHLGLGDAAPGPVSTAADGPGDLAQALLDTGRVLPLLDGFDELPPALHPVALDALNRALPAKQSLVLTSRTAPYRAALNRADTTAAVRLNGAAAIQLLPLSPEQAAVYLRRDAGGPDTPAAARWDIVISQLGTDTPVGHALSTPLGLFLARTIYTPRPHIAPGPAAPYPDELCDTTVFPDRAAVDTHLFNAFIPAAYTPDSPRPLRWTAEQALPALVFLARFLQTHRGGSPDLAWWEIPQAIPARTRRLTSGLANGLTVGLPAGLIGRLEGGPAVGIGVAMAVGIAVGIRAGRTLERRVDASIPRTQLRWRPAGLVFWLLFGLVAGIIYGLMAGFVVGLIAGLTVAIGGGITSGLRREEPDLATVNRPASHFSLNRRAYIVGRPVSLSALVLIAYLVTGGSMVGFVLIVMGAFAVVTVGELVGEPRPGHGGEWSSFVMAQAYLVMHRKVPWDLMGFLQDAHEHRYVLRQVGAVYQFRHIELQRYLAQQ
ncbi:NACHT domain-containing protein [Streptomyces sp. NPDC101165]|uniref:NACHT domain-containing protein n=1 Tax=Streptomyces sp. NPDC101165 TaxID=3366119 RepID=UPI003816B38B